MNICFYYCFHLIQKPFYVKTPKVEIITFHNKFNTFLLFLHEFDLKWVIYLSLYLQISIVKILQQRLVNYNEKGGYQIKNSYLNNLFIYNYFSCKYLLNFVSFLHYYVVIKNRIIISRKINFFSIEIKIKCHFQVACMRHKNFSISKMRIMLLFVIRHHQLTNPVISIYLDHATMIGLLFHLK